MWAAGTAFEQVLIPAFPRRSQAQLVRVQRAAAGTASVATQERFEGPQVCRCTRWFSWAEQIP